MTSKKTKTKKSKTNKKITKKSKNNKTTKKSKNNKTKINKIKSINEDIGKDLTIPSLINGKTRQLTYIIYNKKPYGYFGLGNKSLE